MTFTKKRRLRLYGKRKVKLPMPVRGKKDKGFALRSIEEADSRYAVVKTMRNRLELLKEETGTDTIAKEWLAGRAVFLLAYCETQETNALEGKDIDWKQYLFTVRSLAEVLNKLGGLHKDITRGVKRLENYIIEANKNGRK